MESFIVGNMIGGLIVLLVGLGVRDKLMQGLGLGGIVTAGAILGHIAVGF